MRPHPPPLIPSPLSRHPPARPGGPADLLRVRRPLLGGRVRPGHCGGVEHPVPTPIVGCPTAENLSPLVKTPRILPPPSRCEVPTGHRGEGSGRGRAAAPWVEPEVPVSLSRKGQGRTGNQGRCWPVGGCPSAGSGATASLFGRRTKNGCAANRFRERLKPIASGGTTSHLHRRIYRLTGPSPARAASRGHPTAPSPAARTAGRRGRLCGWPKPAGNNPPEIDKPLSQQQFPGALDGHDDDCV